MDLRRAFRKKRLIATSMVFVFIALIVAYMFLDADTNQTVPAPVHKDTAPVQNNDLPVQNQAAPAHNKVVQVYNKTAPEQNKALSMHGDVASDQNKDVSLQSEAATVEISSPSFGSVRPGVVEKQIQRMPAIEYKELNTGSALDQMMEKRLQALGIKKSLDMIVRSDESFTVGDKKVSMREILEKAYTRKQKIFKTRISQTGEAVPERIEKYGIYVVQPGDNIWNIHFNILKEYYASKGIHVAMKADEPIETGHSSGVGKILKFSEIMVIIYNMVDEKIVTDIDLIQPLSKIVIYNMSEVFSLLAEISFEKINQLRFDGRTIWIPAHKT
ncbi:MAG: hypothetical protein K9K21_01125 [Desulfotignum sp.]|nr:hypothetical protein [Desulfotignum sp.]MCF8112433.1 hypothetical protein [Desulfotignum sp.]MCF8124754.1 hypothetical protein [Desulfotignum sp.]